MAAVHDGSDEAIRNIVDEIHSGVSGHGGETMAEAGWFEYLSNDSSATVLPIVLVRRTTPPISGKGGPAF